MMPQKQQRSALVLQGGGALGAYEWGAAQRLYADKDFDPDFIAGVSIGAITAALLARPAPGLSPLQALEKFWDAVGVSAWFLPPPWRQYASVLGNPRFFMPRSDLYAMASWTNIYDLAPLRVTLKELLNIDALEDRNTAPRLLVSATNIEEGAVEYFDSQDGINLDHIIASGSLPPSFPMTIIDKKAYWDGGLFDNTPLGAVLKKLQDGPDIQRTIYVVNLFPNKAPIPRSLAEVAERTLNLQFANKTCEDLKLFNRFNDVAKLMQELEKLPDGHAIKTSDAYIAVKAQNYVHVPDIVPITRDEQAAGFDGSDFSPEAIKRRAEEGRAATETALGGAKSRRPKRN